MSLSVVERDRAVTLLRESSEALLSLVEPLTPEQWGFREAPDRWSTGEIVEHLALVEKSLFGQVKAALAAPPNPDWRTATAGKADIVEQLLLDRTQVRGAPSAVRPTASASRADVVALYKDRRAETMTFAQATDAALHEHTQDHFRPVYGTLSAYHWLLYIPLHNLRHNQQIAEIAADPGFPL